MRQEAVETKRAYPALKTMMQSVWTQSSVRSPTYMYKNYIGVLIINATQSCGK